MSLSLCVAFPHTAVFPDPFYFSIDDQAYVGLGHGAGIFTDFYRWAQGAWTAIADIPGGGKVAGTQFTFQGEGYVLSGDGPDHSFLPTGVIRVTSSLSLYVYFSFETV